MPHGYRKLTAPACAQLGALGGVGWRAKCGPPSPGQPAGWCDKASDNAPPLPQPCGPRLPRTGENSKASMIRGQSPRHCSSLLLSEKRTHIPDSPLNTVWSLDLGLQFPTSHPGEGSATEQTQAVLTPGHSTGAEERKKPHLVKCPRHWSILCETHLHRK